MTSIWDAISGWTTRVWSARRATERQLDPCLPTPPSCIQQVCARELLKHPEEDEFLQKLMPASVQEAPLPSYDPGVLNNELLNLKLFSSLDKSGTTVEPEGDIVSGTYHGTQVALTQIYEKIEHTYATIFDVLAIEPTFPRHVSLEDKKKVFVWSEYPNKADGTRAEFPPHLATGHIPKEEAFTPFGMFNALGVLETEVMMLRVTPSADGFLGRTKEWLVEKARAAAYGSDPTGGVTMDDVVQYNRHHRKVGTDIGNGGNIGLLDDWFGDRRFADQQLTGTNPTTLERAGDRWTAEFVEAARTASETGWEEVLSKADPTSLFVQDCSYLRAVVGEADPAAILSNGEDKEQMWAVGAVSLFQLHDHGALHPVAICIDYKGSMAASVTLFNKRESPMASTAGEKDDWPWRYAKTCAHVSDWMRHEMGVHLAQAHLVEEATIVAAHRTLPMDHAVYRLLSPHWYKTLSVNAAARSSLVPQVITELVGLTKDQCYALVRHHFETFDFQAHYVPNDLVRRGFPADEAALSTPRYRNYPYARNMVRMWAVMGTYVRSMLSLSYASDDDVRGDPYLVAWADEMRGPGHVRGFPVLDSLDALADAVTMCIHLAAPYHNTVNYLQNFYQAFVAARPPALCAAPPTTLAAMTAVAEHDLVAAVPVGRQRQWLLAAQLPWLLSSRVDRDRSLLNFAASQWRVYKYKRGEKEQRVRHVSAAFYADLQALQRVFYHHSRAMAEGSIPYMVMDPGVTAVSILI